jgi:crotonobetainyl-CoA:carnitine CoA-transferase CaiB-like acyl-CoA transferase
VLVAYYQRLRTGCGDYVDFSRYEAVLQTLDPPFGAQGQAAVVRGMTKSRGRPKNQDAYPIFACRDGWVRICVLAPRQWRALRCWLGEPREFQDPKFDGITARAAVFDQIGALIAQKFAGHTIDELVEMGAAHGVPVAGVLTPLEVRSDEHFHATAAWATAQLSPDTVLPVPDGCLIIDGQRRGLRWLAPAVGSSRPQWVSPPVDLAKKGNRPCRPFDGLRILDLGVIVAGGELARLFADLGAEVIKVESPTYPDGLRQARPGQVMSESFAWTRRNQLGLGLDLRTAVGAELFARLVGDADAVFANFKPGTLAALGFSYSALQTLNPRVVLTESSAYGNSGPWSTRMGYGPLVRASTGITHLWTAEDPQPGSRHPFSDAVTVFPDHIVSRLAAIATLAALIRRNRTGQGAHIHLSQAETAVNQLDVVYATAWAREQGLAVTEDRSVHGVYPCEGDDEWCVITIGDDDDWRAVTSTMQRAELTADPRYATTHARWDHRAQLRAVISEFTRRQTALTLATRLQCLGVAAGPMQRGEDVLADPQVAHRGVYRAMVHPLFDVALPSETGPAPYRRIPPAELRPAPALGEHTRDICRRVLGLSPLDTERLIAAGVLFAPPVPSPTVGRSL